MSKNFEIEKAPRMSAAKIITNNLFLLKLVFSAAPFPFALYAFEQFRVAFMIFFEHTLLIKTVLDCVQYQRPFSEALIPILIIAAILFVTSILGSVTGQWLQPKAVLAAETKLKNMIFDKAKDVDLKCFDDPQYYNEFNLTVEKAPQLVAYMIDIVAVLASSLGTLVTTGVYFSVESKPVFLLVLFSSVLYVFLSIKVSKLNYSKYTTTRKYERKTEYIRRIFYLPDYAKEIRLNGEVKDQCFEKYGEAYDGMIDNLVWHSKKINMMQLLNWGIQTLLLDMGTTLFLVYQASVKETLTYAAVIVMMNACWRLSRSFRNIVYKIATSAENCMYVEKIKSFLKLENEITSEENLETYPRPCSLELKNVSFGYTGKGRQVIDNVSIKVDPGEKIALVGSNGAGKTTLIKLIMRLYDPTDGEVLLDGVNIKKYDVEKYRHNIGVVFQDFNIYASSVADNVAMGDPVNDEKVHSALENSGFGERLAGMEQGEATQLTKEFDDEGVNLSGGESQMIAIARAFYKNSGIIILDEPSSALDPISEYRFNRYMAEAAKNKTVIFISHRLSTTRLADRIIVLENGSVCEEGTHEELLEKKGVYFRMWHAQADKYAL